jgi:hypothetical protein
MGNYLHRTTKQYLRSWSPNELSEPIINYIVEPDLSNVIGVPAIYWVITGDTITEMSQVDKDNVDAIILSNSRDSELQAEIDRLESVNRQFVKLMVDEINILRQQFNATTAESGQLTDTALADRTLDQVRTQIRNSLGS